jgi:phage terminase Nu1 subunit (DNA packaging protein)
LFDKIADRVERLLPILNQKDIDDLKEEIEEEFNLPKITQKIIIRRNKL